MEWIFDPNIWIAFVTLPPFEPMLWLGNIIVITTLSGCAGRCAKHIK
ncbi:MAG: hypothetical protein HS105_04790 [Chloracidobacterium sp.]|nr:hypothetical protein [Chloracidobacterium sp.]